MATLTYNSPINLREYADFLKEVKTRIRRAQVKAALSINRELILLYWEIGYRLDAMQKQYGWGSAVIPRLAKDLRNELPELKGFSERNIGRMLAFFREYPRLKEILPPLVAKTEVDPSLPQPVAKKGRRPDESVTLESLLLHVPWGHNILLIEKVKDHPDRLWYVQNTLENGWSRHILNLMIDSRAHERQGKAITNFHAKLPPAQSDLARQSLKDPYIFDFLTIEQPFHERELETGLVRHLEKFLLELGAGFAFVGRQVDMEVGKEDFYLDLLFYHLKLRCFVVIELKTGPFKPDYAGKMNFYLNAVDDRLRHPSDQPSIGLILCQEKDKVLAEYALRGMTKAIGVSKYQLTRALPKKLKSSLPSIEEIEAELSEVKPAQKQGRKTENRAGRKGKR
ncbi:MAG: PDDEXK nuclease domain-containing protein [Candidatus Manganitrophaceae bacterium]